MKAAVVFGTRPEAIKMAPVVKELRQQGIQCITIATAQHREMLDDMLRVFGIRPDHDLNLMKPDQSLFDVTIRVLGGMQDVLRQERPDVVLVQGDTTTTFAASLAAFYLQIPVGHVEAGLRTGNKYNPFPEEINRRLSTRLTDFHFPPTQWAAQNLLREGVPPESIAVTGNTVIDALLTIVDPGYVFPGKPLNGLDFTAHRVLLLTAHRRENFGAPMEEVFTACRDLVNLYPDVELVYPVHPNPNVRRMANDLLASVPRIHLIDPLDYTSFVQLMSRCFFILSDSGGVQEEAPTLGKPVLVLRSTTERPEAIEAGTARLVGTDRSTILREAGQLLTNPDIYRHMSTRSNPYGDGKAAERIVNFLKQGLGAVQSKR